MTIKANSYKQTEIGEIPEDWKVGLLGDFCDVKGGKRLPKGENLVEYKTSHPYIRIRDITEYGIDKLNLQYLFDSTHQKIKRYIVNRDDVYLSIVGTIGLTGIINDELDGANLTENAAKLFNFKGLDSRFLTYFLKSSFGQSQIHSRTVGSTQPKLALFRIKNIKIPVMSLSEQEEIASILSSLDEKIELNRRINGTLEEIGRDLFKHWFVDFEFPNNDGTYTDVELKGFIDFNPKDNLRKGDTVRYVEMKDLPEQGMWVSSRINKPYKGASKFRNGDTLMARITPCLENGKSAFVNFLDAGELAFGSTEFIVLRPKNKFYEEYVYYIVRDEEFREYAIKSMIGSSGRQRVQIDAIKDYKLSLPSTNLVREFHYTVRPVFEQIRNNSIENETLSSLRDSLLPRLMSGRIRI